MPLPSFEPRLFPARESRRVEPDDAQDASYFAASLSIASLLSKVCLVICSLYVLSAGCAIDRADRWKYLQAMAMSGRLHRLSGLFGPGSQPYQLHGTFGRLLRFLFRRAIASNNAGAPYEILKPQLEKHP